MGITRWFSCVPGGLNVEDRNNDILHWCVVGLDLSNGWRVGLGSDPTPISPECPVISKHFLLGNRLLRLWHRGQRADLWGLFNLLLAQQRYLNIKTQGKRIGRWCEMSGNEKQPKGGTIVCRSEQRYRSRNQTTELAEKQRNRLHFSGTAQEA